MTDRTGQRLDDYHLLRLLGQGTFGDVYLAEHVHQGGHVAVKVLTTQFDQEMIKNFLNEARTLFLLRHPSIVPLLDFGIYKEIPFLVIEYAPNGTLRQRHLPKERVPLHTVTTYVQQVGSALQYAHERRLIHRDVKPQNILLGRNNQVLLSDFGVTAIAHSDNSLTSQEMTGTVPYIAPEQIQGRPRPATDQYALAICVYEWLCGVRPFLGSTWEIINQHMLTPPATLRTYAPELPVAVEDVVLRALAKNPDERFARITDFAVALWQASQSAVSFPSIPASNVPPKNVAAPLTPIVPGPEPFQGSLLAAPGPKETHTDPSRPGNSGISSVPPGQLVIPEQQEETMLLSPNEQILRGLTPIPPFPSIPPLASSPPSLPPSASALGMEQLPPPAFPGNAVQLPSTMPPVAAAPRRHRRARYRWLLLVGILSLLAGAILGPLWISNHEKQAFLAATATEQVVQATAAARATIAAPAYKSWVSSNGTMFGFDAAHTHWNRLEQIISPGNVTHLHPLWSYQTGGGIETSLIVANGLLYAGSDDGKVYAFNANCLSNCQPQWSYLTGGFVRSSPAVANGILYIGSDDGKLYAFDATCQSGCQPLWSHTTAGGIDSPPTVANGIVYVGSWNNKIYAFDAACRSGCLPLWSYTTDGGIYSSPAVAGGMVYISSVDGKLYVFDAACRSNCKPLWSYATGNGIYSSPAVAGGMVYVGSNDHKLYAFDATCRSNCQPLWSYTTGKSIHSSPAVARGMVYVGSDDHKLYAFDAACRSNCQPLWSYATGGGVFSSPTVANGVVYVGSGNQRLYTFDASCRSNCQPLWSYKTNGVIHSSPTVVDGIVYIGTQSHTFYAFGLEA